MQYIRSVVLLVAVVTLVPWTASAQLSAGGKPLSFDPAVATVLTGAVPEAKMPPVDVAAAEAADAERAARGPVPWRFGVNVPVILSATRDGVWERLADGRQVWRLGIASPGALTINLLFERFRVPEGGELFVYSADREHVLGAFTSANHQPSGKLPTTLVPGDTIVVEYDGPAGSAFPPELVISRVTHGYKDVYRYADKAYGSSGACNNDVVCPVSAGWEAPIRSVVMLVSGGSGFCSGALVNNTANDGRPFVLTANHCYSDPAGWVFWFNWESGTCPASGPVPPYDSLAGAELRARRSESDFCLVELNDAVPAEFAAHWSGWDHTGDVPTSTVGIHHPAGDVKKISFDYDAPGISDYYSAGTSHWQVFDWDDGTTEGGSSGSPLFDQNQRIIGQLHGGDAACGNDLQDYYGRVSVSWDGPNAAQRLRDWLDPSGVSTGTLDGIDAGGPPPALDASLSSFVFPAEGGLLCETTVTPIVTVRNRGTTDITTLEFIIAYDGGAPSSFPWVGLIPAGTTVDVTLPSETLTAGPRTLTVETANPNGGIDERPSNDAGSVNFEISLGATAELPFEETFEGPSFPPGDMRIDNPDGGDTWVLNTDAGGFGASAQSAFVDNFTNDFRGQSDYLLTPIIDFTGFTTPLTLEFVVAYARYNESLHDGLAVNVSTDCGDTWTQVYFKENTDLSTTGVDVSGGFVPTADQWRTETVSLDAWEGATSVLVAVENISGWGNNLYVDDIRITGAPVVTPDDQDGDGFTEAQGDCDDNDASIFPGAPEDCDGRDDDCDGQTDEFLACAIPVEDPNSPGCLPNPVPTGTSQTAPAALLLLPLLFAGVMRRRR